MRITDAGGTDEEVLRRKWSCSRSLFPLVSKSAVIDMTIRKDRQTKYPWIPECYEAMSVLMSPQMFCTYQHCHFTMSLTQGQW